MTNRGDHHTITTHPVLVLTHRVFVVVKEDFIQVQLYTIGGASVNLNKLLFPCIVFSHSVAMYYSTTFVPLPQRDRISEGLKSRCQPRGLSWLVPPERIALLWLLCICAYLCICLMVYLCIRVINWAELVS